MESEPLSGAAMETFRRLFVRAVVNGQFAIHRASPFASAEEWEASGFGIDDDGTGNSVRAPWPVEVSEDAKTGREEIGVYVDADNLRALVANGDIKAELEMMRSEIASLDRKREEIEKWIAENS